MFHLTTKCQNSFQIAYSVSQLKDDEAELLWLTVSPTLDISLFNLGLSSGSIHIGICSFLGELLGLCARNSHI